MGARLALALALCLPLVGSASAVLVKAKSRFTTIDLTACRPLPVQHEGGAWRCEGLEGYPVFVAEDGARSYMSFGPEAEKRRAATQTLRAHNVPFEGRTRRVAVEWRVITRDDRPIPYATIVRYFTRDTSGSGQVLVVTRVTPFESCRVAYIDALANAEAIVLARQLADEQARSFDCKAEPEIAGETGKSPM